jgi:type I restriction enzyme M protein
MGSGKNNLGLFPVDRKKILGDFYWEYADILRGIGVPPATYDQRIMAMMAVKLLIDNDKLMFNFEYNKQFGLSNDKFQELKGENTKATFKNIIANIETLGNKENLKFFTQPAIYNPGTEDNILAYLNHPKVFTLDAYIEELPNHYLEMVLDIYTYKANFTDYPKEQYKDLYEKTISRMKKLVGDLTGQHFTQKSIIQLMCEMALKQVKKNKTIAIYDPTSGTGSMIMEAAHYFHNHFKNDKKPPKIAVYGQEYHAQTWLLSKIFLEISSLDGVQQGINNRIAFGNTLTAPMFAKDINGDDSFDFIIANPPFGVDWKHDYETVLDNMKSPDSHFMVVKDEKRKIVTPKKSDGQFLFMQHIIKLMHNEKARGKRAFAAVISSSTLISTGGKTGQSAQIREKIFDTGFVKAVVEQPTDMFTNTNIGSHIWFLDTEGAEFIRILKADNLENPLFTPLPVQKDKMKNGYSEDNIKTLVKYIEDKKERPYISKNVAKENCTGIPISSTIGHKIVELDYDLDILEQQINDLFKELQDLHFNP